MSTSRKSVQRRLITPEAWGKKNVLSPQSKDPAGRQCSHCSHKGLVEEQTIAGMMYRCPACKKLQF
jgi:hypothetical protein